MKREESGFTIEVGDENIILTYPGGASSMNCESIAQARRAIASYWEAQFSSVELTEAVLRNTLATFAEPCSVLGVRAWSGDGWIVIWPSSGSPQFIGAIDVRGIRAVYGAVREEVLRDEGKKWGAA